MTFPSSRAEAGAGHKDNLSGAEDVIPASSVSHTPPARNDLMLNSKEHDHLDDHLPRADHIGNELEDDDGQSIWRDFFSEFFGTLVLVLIGDGALAQLKLSNGAAGDWASVSGAWG